MPWRSAALSAWARWAKFSIGMVQSSKKSGGVVPTTYAKFFFNCENLRPLRGESMDARSSTETGVFDITDWLASIVANEFCRYITIPSKGRLSRNAKFDRTNPGVGRGPPNQSA